MADALGRKLRGGSAFPTVLVAVLALILIGALLWWGLRRAPQSEPVAALASPTTSRPTQESGLRDRELRAEAPQQPARGEPAASAPSQPPATEAPVAVETDLQDKIQNPSALAALGRGIEAQQRGDVAASMAAFLEAAELEPGNVFLLNEIGGRAWSLGRLGEAATFYERALSAEEQRSGSDAPDVAAAMSRLAAVYADQERYGDAEALYEHALAIAQKSAGSREGGVASAQAHLGSLYQRQGRNDKALVLFESALASSRQASGGDPAETARILSAMGTLYEQEGRPHEALTHLEEAVELFEKSLGPEDPTVTRELVHLARLAGSQGSFEEAKPYYERAYVNESKLAAGRSHVTNDLVRRAFESYEQGQIDEARSILTFARERSEALLGAEHPSTIVLAGQLAALEKKVGGR